MIEKALSAFVALLLVAVLAWWFNSNIRDYYQRPLIEAHKIALAEQKAANARAVADLKETKATIRTVYVDKLKVIETYAQNLTPNLGCLADEPFARLYNGANKR